MGSEVDYVIVNQRGAVHHFYCGRNLNRIFGIFCQQPTAQQHRYDPALDGWGGPLLLLTGIIIVAGVLASWTLARREQEYFVLLLVLVSGVFGGGFSSPHAGTRATRIRARAILRMFTPP